MHLRSVRLHQVDGVRNVELEVRVLLGVERRVEVAIANEFHRGRLQKSSSKFFRERSERADD
ncbi:hypothetical protein [Haladaptatus sp. DYF46]|uniref:hypothetical protein n=1 Tax=Haladaptatus sp. DYF46 TaxID=2886041 RepID=UPI001E5FB51A|nr:hypothetical protein [Haladaptatus sp. DYF46]